MPSSSFDVRIEDVRFGGDSAFNGSGFSTSHPQYVIREVHSCLKKLPPQFTWRDLAQIKDYNNETSAHNLMKRMRRMQMIRRIEPGSPIHEIVPMYRNRIC